MFIAWACFRNVCMRTNRSLYRLQHLLITLILYGDGLTEIGANSSRKKNRDDSRSLIRSAIRKEINKYERFLNSNSTAFI